MMFFLPLVTSTCTSIRSQIGWEPALGYRECSSILLGVIKIPRPILRPVVDGGVEAKERQRGGNGSGSGKGSSLRRDEDRERLSRSSFGNISDASGRWRNSVRDDDQGEPSVCLDRSGIGSLFCDTVQFIHRSVSNFVSKTSILQSVNNNSSSVAPSVEMYSTGMPLRTAIRTVSGELDGGNTDF